MPDHSAYRALQQGQQERFPTLRGLRIKQCWSGYVSAAYDALPVVGTTGPHHNIHYVAGCSGHGLCQHSFMGMLLAERINGTEHPTLAALGHKTPRTLPEPFQWLALKSAFAVTGIYDRWTNRKAQKVGGK